MPLGNSIVEVRLSALMTRLIGSSPLESRTELGSDGTFRFADGTGALQASAVVDVTIPCDNVAVAFSTFTRTDGNAFGAATKLKAVIFFNPSANAATTVTSSVTGVAVGKLDPGGLITWISPTTAGLTISGASTFTSNGGGAGQSIRAILLVA